MRVYICDKEEMMSPDRKESVRTEQKWMLVLKQENRDLTCLLAADCVGCLGEK